LLGRGASVTATDHAANTALHWASFAGNVDVIRLLARCGAPLDAANQDGDTALHFASKWARPDVVQVGAKRWCC
ncbi:ankyrin repeat-containing domain protein, partial [Tribonema minus]